MLSTEIRARLVRLLEARFGRVEEQLQIDSLSAVELGLTIKNEFQVPLEALSLADMNTISSLSDKITLLVSERKAAG